MRKSILVAIVATLLASTPAFAKDPGVCIRHDDIRNWSSPDDKHLVLENYRHQKAMLTLIGTCSGFKFTETIMIRSPGGTDLSCIAPGDIVRTRDIGMRGQCAIVKVEPYTGPIGHHDDHSSDHRDNDHHGDSH